MLEKSDSKKRATLPKYAPLFGFVEGGEGRVDADVELWQVPLLQKEVHDEDE